MNEFTIFHSILAYKEKNCVRFHMPGHKGRKTGSFLDAIVPYDLTEIQDTDNLLEPAKNGSVHASFEKAKAFYGTSSTIFSTQGATLALQTAIAAVTRKSGIFTILCDRLAHQSVVHAFALCDIQPIWFDPTEWKQQLLEKLAQQSVSAVIVTSPDYYGRMMDIAAISAICHRFDVPLLVDNSHGAHLICYEKGRLHAYKNGADLVVDSIHKTLPALTGTALLHSNERFTTEELLESMRLFCSTSPSYVLMASICHCMDYMEQNGEKELIRLLHQIQEVKLILRKMGLETTQYPLSDPFRLCIDTHGKYDGNDFYRSLQEKNVVCEFSDARHIVLLPSVCTTEEDFAQFLQACRQYVAETPPQTIEFSIPSRPSFPECAMRIREATFRKAETIPLRQANGRISALPYAPYPPGIPFIMPGERWNVSLMECLGKYGVQEVSVIKE